jgi:hypothetical protein
LESSKKWQMATGAASIFLAGTLVGTPLVSAATTYVKAILGTTNIQSSGKSSVKASTLSYGNKTYVELGAVQSALRSDGFQSTWSKNALTLIPPSLPSSTSSTIVLNGKSSKESSINYKGQTYISALGLQSALTSSNTSAKWSGSTLNINVNSNPDVHTAHVNINGQTQTTPDYVIINNRPFIEASGVASALSSVGAVSSWSNGALNISLPFQPPAPGNNVVSLGDMPTLTKSDSSDDWTDQFTDNLGNVYEYGAEEVNTYWGGGSYDATFYLNGKYKQLTGTLAPNNQWSKESEQSDIGQLQIYGDGKLLYDSGPVASDITDPISVNVDLTGVMKLEIVLQGKDVSDDYGTTLGFANVMFSK